MTRIVIVDDQALFREGLRTLLSIRPDMDVVGEAASGDEAITLVEQLRPSVVLMDLRMPKVDGIQATARLRERCPEIPVLVLTTFDDDANLFGALRAGAVGYLLKSWTPERLRQALKSLLRPPQAATPAATISERFPKLAGSSHYDRVAELGPRHLQILELILEGCSNQEISKATELSLGTVKNYVSAILLALDVDSRSHLISLFH